MSRLKNISRAGWVIVGLVAALILVPSGVAAAKAITYTGIQGAPGDSSRVGVNPGGEMLTAQNQPFLTFPNMFDGMPNTNVTTSSCASFGSADLSSSEGAFITNIEISVYSPPAGVGTIWVYNNNSCNGSAIAVYNVPSGSLGTQEFPFSTAAPDIGPDGTIGEGGSGDYFSAVENGGLSASVIVNGYVTTTT